MEYISNLPLLNVIFLCFDLFKNILPKKARKVRRYFKTGDGKKSLILSPLNPQYISDLLFESECAEEYYEPVFLLSATLCAHTKHLLLEGWKESIRRSIISTKRTDFFFFFHLLDACGSIFEHCNCREEMKN